MSLYNPAIKVLVFNNSFILECFYFLSDSVYFSRVVELVQCCGRFSFDGVDLGDQRPAKTICLRGEFKENRIWDFVKYGYNSETTTPI